LFEVIEFVKLTGICDVLAKRDSQANCYFLFELEFEPVRKIEFALRFEFEIALGVAFLEILTTSKFLIPK
jgi:hypothetical protein